MRVAYNCEVVFDEYEFLTEADIAEAKRALNDLGYEVYLDDKTLTVNGDIEVDADTYTPEDIAYEIHRTLWDAAEIDADATAEEVEPDDRY